MIELKGSVRRQFSLNGPPPAVYKFLADVTKTVDWMPSVAYVQTSDDQIHRLKYGSKELGMYDVSVFCDVKEVRDPEFRTYQLKPAVSKSMAPVETSVNSEFARTSGELKVIVKLAPSGETTAVTFEFGVYSKYQIEGYSWFAEMGIQQMLKPMISSRMNDSADQFVKNVKSAYAKETV